MTDGRSEINLVLLGAPGAGKGTQAAYLVKAYGLLHVSTGNMLRETVKSGSELGKTIQKYMNKGELVPDEIVTRGVIDRIAKPDADKGMILDGYPRNKAQAESLDEALKKINKPLTVVLYMRTGEDVVIERLSGRRVCPKCGFNYHIKNIPPKTEDICDKCNEPLIQRQDDNIDTIRKRFKVYEESTKDLIEYYRNKGILEEVDGGMKADELFGVIDGIFKKKGFIDVDSEA